MMSCTGSVRGGFWEIWEKSVSWVLPWEKMVDFRLLAVALCQVRTCFGADGKASIDRLCLSPYVEKAFNSKVIKSLVPEVRSRKCFSCFPDSYVLCIYVMNILCTFHIFMYGYVTVLSNIDFCFRTIFIQPNLLGL